jgi:hypothetical protein
MATRTLLGFAPDLWSCLGGRGVPKASLDDRGVLVFTGEGAWCFIPSRAFSGGHYPREAPKSFLSGKLRNA